MKESNEELIDRFSNDPCDDSLGNEILSRLDRIEELEKENKELKEGLFEKFSECYEVNKWTPESGFDRQLDFYIHESWKREPVVDKLRKQVENLKCCGNCLNYIYDMEEDHHYCNKQYPSDGYCDNWQSDNMTREDRK